MVLVEEKGGTSGLPSRRKARRKVENQKKKSSLGHVTDFTLKPELRRLSRAERST